MEPTTYKISINLSDYTIGEEILDNLACEYCGKILESNDDNAQILDLEFEQANDLKAFKKTLDLTYKKK